MRQNGKANGGDAVGLASSLLVTWLLGKVSTPFSGASIAGFVSGQTGREQGTTKLLLVVCSLGINSV
jgi:hypothetical protein